MSLSSSISLAKFLEYAEFSRLRDHQAVFEKGSLLHGGQDQRNFLELSGNILALEKLLIDTKAVYLHGAVNDGKTTLLRHLSRIWLLTGFVEQVVWIETRQFLNPWIQRNLRYIREQMRRDSIFYKKNARATENNDDINDTHTVVIIDHVDVLYSDGGTKEAQLFGQSQLRSFLQRIASGKVPENCYLIMVGVRDDDWWEDTFDPILAGRPLFHPGKGTIHRVT